MRYDYVPAVSAAVLAAPMSAISTDTLESLLVALVTLGVRELLYWLRNRRRGPTALPRFPDDNGGR
jgi:hypothetical protein